MVSEFEQKIIRNLLSVSDAFDTKVNCIWKYSASHSAKMKKFHCVRKNMTGNFTMFSKSWAWNEIKLLLIIHTHNSRKRMQSKFWKENYCWSLKKLYFNELLHLFIQIFILLLWYQIFFSRFQYIFHLLLLWNEWW